MPRHAGQMRQVLATFIRPRPMQGRHVSWGGGLRSSRRGRAMVSSMCFIWGLLLHYVVLFTLSQPSPLCGKRMFIACVAGLVDAAPTAGAYPARPDVDAACAWQRATTGHPACTARNSTAADAQARCAQP